MKVLAVVVVPAHVKVSGAVNAAVELSAALRAHCDIAFARLSDHDGEVNHEGLTVRHVRGRLPLAPVMNRMPNKVRGPLYYSALPRLVREAPYDLVHIHNPVPALEMRRIARACRAAKIPYVVSTHGFVEIDNGGKGYRLGAIDSAAFHRLIWQPVRDTVSRAAGILALSEADLPIVARFGGAAIPTRIAPNGVSLPRIADRAKLAALRAMHGLAGSEPVLLYLGSHAPNKGLPLLFEALLCVKQNFTLLVGGERRPQLDYENFAQRLKPSQRVVFLGFVPDDSVRDYYALADIFVFPSLADTFPLVVLEAMAARLAIVASSVGGVPHQLEGDSGVLVPPGDTVALAGAIDALIDDPARRAALGIKATARAGGEFSWPAAAKIAYELYETVA
jgi:starch synthase